MATKLAALKRRAKQAGIPSIYVNDNLAVGNPTSSKCCAIASTRTSAGSLSPRSCSQTPRTILCSSPSIPAFMRPRWSLPWRAPTLILTGIAGNICVLFTANDAYMREYRLIIPADCVASQTVRENTSALRLMQTVLTADIRPSTALDLPHVASLQSL